MPFLSILGGFASRYWKQLAIGVAVLGLVLGIYWKGRIDCGRKVERARLEETKKRYEAYTKTNERSEEVQRKVQDSRRASPSDDVRDSCLLSSNPYEVDCVAH